MERFNEQTSFSDSREISVLFKDGRVINLGHVSGMGAIIVAQSLDLADAGGETRYSWRAYARTHKEPDAWDNRPA